MKTSSRKQKPAALHLVARDESSTRARYAWRGVCDYCYRRRVEVVRTAFPDTNSPSAQSICLRCAASLLALFSPESRADKLINGKLIECSPRPSQVSLGDNDGDPNLGEYDYAYTSARYIGKEFCGVCHQERTAVSAVQFSVAGADFVLRICLRCAAGVARICHSPDEEMFRGEIIPRTPGL